MCCWWLQLPHVEPCTASRLDLLCHCFCHHKKNYILGWTLLVFISVKMSMSLAALSQKKKCREQCWHSKMSVTIRSCPAEAYIWKRLEYGPLGTLHQNKYWICIRQDRQIHSAKTSGGGGVVQLDDWWDEGPAVAFLLALWVQQPVTGGAA